MRGSHVVTAIFVATIASGGLFYRNRLAQEEYARVQLAEKARVDVEKSTKLAGNQDGGAASDKSASSGAASDRGAGGDSAGDPVRISTRITTLPRKKPMKWRVDLDGDGEKELLIGHQVHPSDTWVGGDEGAPHASVEVLSSTGSVLLKHEWIGYMHGFWRHAVEIGGNARVAMYQRSEPDDGDGKHVWIAKVAGRLMSKPFERVPSQVIDVMADGIEQLVVLSPELYQDFFVKGTMDVLRWNGGGWTSVLPLRAFEVCALDPGMRRPIAYAAISRDKPHQLHVLGYNAKPQMYVSRQQLGVEAPAGGSEFTIEQGFALHCMASGDGSVHQRVQYKDRFFTFTDARLIEVKTQAKASAK